MQTKQIWKIGDCLELLPEISNNSIDLIITDPPYNVLQVEWDKQEIDWIELSWELYRVLKLHGSVYIFGQMPMMNDVYTSFEMNFKFRQDLIWYKNRGFSLTDTLYTKYHENILFFVKYIKNRLVDFGKYIKQQHLKMGLSLKDVGNLCNEKWYHRGGHLYFETGLSCPSKKQYELLKTVLCLDNQFDDMFNKPVFNHEDVKLKGNPYMIRREKQKLYGLESNLGKYTERNNGKRNPKTVLEYPIIQGGDEYVGFPTQKPVKLIEYLIKASSKKDMIVLDPFLGSGTTLEACMNTNRNCIGFDISDECEPYYRKRLRLDNSKLTDTWDSRNMVKVA